MLNNIFKHMQSKLLSGLPWLNEAFGKAYKMYGDSSISSKYTYPAVYTGDGEYMSMLPNDTIGNFSWFDVFDPQTYDSTVRDAPTSSLNMAIVFWFDITSIYENTQEIQTEAVKKEVLDVINKPGFLPIGCRAKVTKVYEKPESIYKGYSAEKFTETQFLNAQFLVHPYFGLRVELTLTTTQLCKS